jgi:hypothetical protein
MAPNDERISIIIVEKSKRIHWEFCSGVPWIRSRLADHPSHFFRIWLSGCASEISNDTWCPQSLPFIKLGTRTAIRHRNLRCIRSSIRSSRQNQRENNNAKIGLDSAMAPIHCNCESDSLKWMKATYIMKNIVDGHLLITNQCCHHSLHKFLRAQVSRLLH